MNGALGIVDLGWFIVCGLMLNLTPGPDFAYITAWSVRQGVRSGVMAALGICTGCLVHVLAATFGLSALLAASANAMSLIKWLGAIYLVWLGAVMMIGNRGRGQSVANDGDPIATGTTRVTALRHIFAQGMLTNILNPKVALFFLAFLPQFVDPTASGKTLAFLVLGLIFTFNGMLCCVGFAWLAGRLMTNPNLGRAGIWLTRAMGAVMAAFGIRLAMWSGT